MENSNKMYSFEIVDKAVSAVAMGFSCCHEGFKKSLEDLPEEIQSAVIASVLAGQMMIQLRMQKIASELPEIEKKGKEMKNPTKEDVDKLFKEAFDKMAEK